ncbi:tetratricopeptide repeat protein [Gilvimarinus sp. F26214L]|uniref:tetratricopeptide repeat protein n=1 Tax=Gilvimarinus sp. DZF01 TaxID=3461371 RepID=UPI0040457813
MSRHLFRFCLLAGLVALASCSSQKPKTLGGLRYEPEPEIASDTQSSGAPASHGEVRTEYEELLDLVDDENLKEQIERRIAHVYMLEGEQEQVEAEPGRSYYLDAIKSYRDILEKYPNSPDNAEILYQLAKAYDMEGDQDEALKMLRELTTRHPDYKNIAEANFRKGDILFNHGAYREAEQAYQIVTTHEESSFNLNAHYMLGWSRYKQLRFGPALDNFVHVLNEIWKPGLELSDLSKPDKSLVQDTLHAVSLSLDKQAGAATIQSIDELKDQHYVWQVYDNLGTYYLDKELYEASAESYRQFVTHYPDQDITPILHRKMIDTYMEGSFPRQAFVEKEKFVDAYGIYSSYARRRGGAVESIQDTMEEYLDELARNYHARGQELHKEIAELTSDERQRPQPDKVEELDEEALTALNKAAYFYKQFIDTFPGHEKLDELLFFRAEALFAAGRFEESIPDYERVAYDPQTPSADQYAADAGYAAIVSYEQHLESLEPDSRDSTLWRGRAVESMLRFAERYHQDQRSPSVLTNAAEYLFSLELYERALEIARALIDNNPELDRQVKKTAYGITAHSLFKLERFAEAAKDYQQQRTLVNPGSKEHRQITERLASAVYKHSEGMIAEEDKAGAVEQLLTLKELTPDSPVRITAQYDAATLLLELQQWSRAIGELRELIALYPEHELATEFPRKLAFAYEKNEDWQLAAKAYAALSELDPDPELRREALYLSGTMYEKDADYNTAIVQLRDYAHTYPDPFSTNMEARYKLTQNYARINDTQKRLFWLQKLVEGHRDAGDNATERSQYLAAWANAEYGDYYAAEFKRHNLYLPLDRSLPAKNEQLEKATSRYQMAADSGLLEFVTMSSYKIAELYQTLADELRGSPRPPGLGDEDRKLYQQILAEQSQPFDEIAMELHRSNIEHAWDGEFNQWIDQSFAMMRELDPRRFAKTELIVSYGDEIR